LCINGSDFFYEVIGDEYFSRKICMFLNILMVSEGDDDIHIESNLLEINFGRVRRINKRTKMKF
jgi:hypothetical protein